MLSGVAFVIFAVFAIRPLLVAMANRSPEGEPVKEVYICITLTLVLACSFVTEIESEGASGGLEVPSEVAGEGEYG